MPVAAPGSWRLSLRTLLALVAVAGFSCAAMLRANERWLLAYSAFALLVVMAAAVAAIFDRGPRQAFALGLLVCAALHLAALRWVDPLPTRQALELAHKLIIQEPFRTSGQSPGAARTGAVKRGDSGPLVAALQGAINAFHPPSPPLEVDGDFGAKTEQAVRDFQRSTGRPADGRVTLATWQALGPVALQELRRHGAPMIAGLLPAESFLRIGEWLMTLLLGYLGGHLAQAAYLRRRREGNAV